MDKFMKRFSELYDGYMLFLVIFIGLFLLLRDVPILEKVGLKRDMKIAKVLGYVYIIGGSILFVIARIL